jgi:hypothetical protein
MFENTRERDDKIAEMEDIARLDRLAELELKEKEELDCE